MYEQEQQLLGSVESIILHSRRNVNMAKAKFPGKPPKTSQITRLRVSSNCSAGANDPSRLAAQQVAFGLKLYRQHFIPDDEVRKARPFAVRNCATTNGLEQT